MQVGINKLENETQLGFINKWADDPWFWLIDPGLLPRKVRACPFAVNHPEVGLKAWMNGVSLHSTWNKSMDWYSCFIHYLMGTVLGAVYIWHSQKALLNVQMLRTKTNCSLCCYNISLWSKSIKGCIDNRYVANWIPLNVFYIWNTSNTLKGDFFVANWQLTNC